jgi:hypothetical protein
VTKKIPKDDNNEEEVSKRASKNFGPEAKKGDSLSEGTPLIRGSNFAQKFIVLRITSN